jgi:hypothetical protein
MLGKEVARGVSLLDGREIGEIQDFTASLEEATAGTKARIAMISQGVQGSFKLAAIPPEFTRMAEQMAIAARKLEEQLTQIFTLVEMGLLDDIDALFGRNRPNRAERRREAQGKKNRTTDTKPWKRSKFYD